MSDKAPGNSVMPVPCPNCGKANLRALSFLETHDGFACDYCGAPIRVDLAALSAPDRQMDESIAATDKAFERAAMHPGPDPGPGTTPPRQAGQPKS